MPLLNPGDPFPRLTMNVLGGETLTVPDAFAGDFATVLFYRGSWCPYCNAQLQSFQGSGQALADAGIRIASPPCRWTTRRPRRSWPPGTA